MCCPLQLKLVRVPQLGVHVGSLCAPSLSLSSVVLDSGEIRTSHSCIALRESLSVHVKSQPVRAQSLRMLLSHTGGV